MKVTREFVINLWFVATVLGICSGITYLWYEDYMIMQMCHEACGTRRLIACNSHTWTEATAFCQDTQTMMTVYELKR